MDTEQETGNTGPFFFTQRLFLFLLLLFFCFAFLFFIFS